MSSTKIKFFGTGPAWPIPRLGCKCRTCEDARIPNSKSRRTRSSLYIEHGDKKILVDCGPDFYHQMIREGVEDLDYVLISHAHNDHVGSLEDVRTIMQRKGVGMPLVTSKEVFKELKEKFRYVEEFDERLLAYGESLEIDGLKISFVPVRHGNYTLAFTFEGDKRFAYFSDISHPLRKEYLQKIMNMDYLILDGSEIMKKSPEFHLSLEKQLEMAREAEAKNIIFTHIGHRCPPHEELERIVKLVYSESKIAYDGMVI